MLRTLLLLLTAAAATAAQPMLLMLGKPHPYVEVEYRQELADHGIDMECASWDSVTPAMLRRYNAVVITGTEAHGDENFMDQKRTRWIDEYIRAGGGCLVVVNTMGWYKADMEHIQHLRDWLAKLGCTIRVEAVMDEGRKVEHACLGNHTIRAAWTDDITAHPVTAGVENVWFATGFGGHGAVQATPTNVDHNWDVLVRTGPDASLKVYEQTPDSLWRSERPAGPYGLLAARPVENGRLAVLGMDPVMTVWTPLHYSLGQFIFRAGAEDRPSDVWKLLENGYRWLAQPSMRMGIYGPEVAELPPVARDTGPIAWDQRKFPPAPTTWYRGLAGAHTALSTGAGTVAEWAAAARAEGLDFLIFTEDLAHMTPEKWQQLQTDCDANTDDTFIAYAGLEAANARGNRSFLLYGPREWGFTRGYLTADGKLTVSRGWNAEKGRMERNADQRSGQIMSYLESKTNGYFDHDGNECPFWDYKLYNLFSVFTRERGKVLDDALDKYLHATTLAVNPAPYTLDLMFEPAALKGALTDGRACLLLCGDADPRSPDEPTLTNVFRRFAVADPRVEWRLTAGGYRGWIGPVVSQGPTLRWMFRGGYRWQGIEFPRYWIERYAGVEPEDWFLTSWYRLKLRLDAGSDVGIAEIVLYDGDRVFRRYAGNGRQQMTVDIDVTQDRNLHLVPVVRDVKGRVALAREIWTEQQMNRYNYCGDRVNNPNSVYSPIHGHPYHRLIQTSRVPPSPKDLVPRWKWPNDVVRRYFLDLVCPDVSIEGYTTDWLYNKQELTDNFGWHNWAPHHVRPDYTFTQRAWDWYWLHGKKVSTKTHPSQHVHWDGYQPEPDPNVPAARPSSLVSFTNEIVLKQPLELDDAGFFWRANVVWEHTPTAEAPGAWQLVAPDGTVTGGSLADVTEPVVGTVPDGAVISWLPGGEDPGDSLRYTGGSIGYRLARGKKNVVTLTVGLVPGDRNVAGETFRWTLERVNRVPEPAQLTAPDWFTVAAGKVIGMPLCELHVRAAGGVADITLARAAFDTNGQPVIVHGVDRRFTTVLYEPGQDRVRPLGVWDGKAYVNLPAADLSGRVLIGNLVVSDTPDVTAELVRLTDGAGDPTGKWLLDAHNNGTEARTVTFRFPPAFGLLKTAEKTVEMPAGTPVRLEVE